MSVAGASSHASILGGALALLFRHRHLTWEMAKREISDLYAGSALGVGWALLHPLVLMAVYVVIFTFVFRVRLAPEGPAADYVIYLMSGLLPWLACSTSLTKSTTAIMGNSSLVKQIVFPIEVLPVKGVLASLIPQMIGTGVLALITLVQNHALPWSYGLLPVLLLLQVATLSGLGWALAAVGAYLRDLKDVIQVLLLMMMYFLPIFYIPESVPAIMRPLILLNPFSYLLQLFQAVLFYGTAGRPVDWVVAAGFALLCFYGGFRSFKKLKVYFGNVL